MTTLNLEIFQLTTLLQHHEQAQEGEFTFITYSSLPSGNSVRSPGNIIKTMYAQVLGSNPQTLQFYSREQNFLSRLYCHLSKKGN
jgi:hypothetical protein